MKNRNLFIIALIAVVNALGYGIIIPILYSYSKKYGLTDFQNGLLFAIFSVCQFASTPFIGRLSDKYGRRPLLIISITGTALSFFMMAFAPTAMFLFLARALDGLTAGNIPVASAVISDTLPEAERAKGFGIIGASFGFGLIFGPVISGLTATVYQALPFIIAGTVSFMAVILTLFLLPETNKHMGQVKKGRIFDFGHLIHALFDENIGATLLTSLFYMFAFSLFIYSFQPFSIKILHLSTQQIAILFTIFGVLNLLMQAFFVQKLVKIVGLKRLFKLALIVMTIAFVSMFVSQSFAFFVLASILLGIAGSIVQPLIPTILSREADAKSQGSILGLNASYMSIGQILGPIVGGLLASFFLPSPFLAGAFLSGVCFYLTFHILKHPKVRESTF